MSSINPADNTLNVLAEAAVKVGSKRRHDQSFSEFEKKLRFQRVQRESLDYKYKRVKLNPDNANDHYALAHQLLLMNHFHEALKYFDRAFRIDPGFEEASRKANELRSKLQ